MRRLSANTMTEPSGLLLKGQVLWNRSNYNIQSIGDAKDKYRSDGLNTQAKTAHEKDSVNTFAMLTRKHS